MDNVNDYLTAECTNCNTECEIDDVDDAENIYLFYAALFIKFSN